jgi:peptide/nickel transport system permease protein
LALLRTIARRLLQLSGVMLGISIVTFLLLHMAPGDPARLLAGERASAETIAAIRLQYGLDLPLWRQFATYLANLAAGDIGQSLRFQRPVGQLIGQFMWPTLFLTGYVVCLAVPPTVALAILSARNPGGTADQAVRLVGIAGLTIPVFWLGIMMSRFFGVSLGWFPVSGYGVGFAGHLHHLFLPALSTAIWLVPVLTQSLRAALIEKAMADFVTAARAQGASEREIFWRTILPNSVLPTLNLLGVMVAFMIGGAVIVETVYAVPGLGTLMIGALLGRDYYVVQGLTLVFALSTVLVTLAVDLLAAFIDPRVRN